MKTLKTYYVLINAILFVILGIWCGVFPTDTSHMVGFDLRGDQGYAEFLAVYGGLEFGLGCFLLYTFFKKECISIGALLVFLTYGSIVLFRLVSLCVFGSHIQGAWDLFSVEIAMAVIGAILSVTAPAKADHPY